MPFDWSTFALQIVNFAILVWLLHRFLYRPVLRLVDARRAEIDKEYADARAAEAAAKAEAAGVAAARAGIAGERAELMQEAAAQAEREAAARRAQAERDAAALLDGARKSLAGERAAVLAEARRAALDLGADIAGRLLAEVPPKFREETWIERITRHIAKLPAAERDGLLQQLSGAVALTVVTAAPLAGKTAEAWRTRLQRALGEKIAVEYGVDAALVAGAELHFPNAILRFSWQSDLSAMRAELEADGDAG